MDDIGRVRNVLKSLEKRLYALNTMLRELYRVKDFLEKLDVDYAELKAIVNTSPELEPLVREYVRDQEILPVVKDVKAKYEAVLNLFRGYLSKLDDMEIYFEKFRNYRFYTMDREKIPILVSLLFEDDDEVFFKQTLTSRPFTQEFAKEVGGVLIDPFTIKLPGERAAPAVERYWHAYGGGFYIESPSYTLVYKPEHGLIKVVFTSPSQIPAVDSTVRRLGGEIINI